VDQPDADLLAKAGRGDEAARAQLLSQHLAGLRAFVHLRLGPALRRKEESQDLVQSVCREVLSDLPKFQVRAGASFRDWMHRAAENKIRDRWRHWKRERRDPNRERALEASDAEAAGSMRLVHWMTPSREAVDREQLALLERVFADLPAADREVIVLARLHGWSHAKLAAHFGRSEVATRSLLSRALARLALALDARE